MWQSFWAGRRGEGEVWLRLWRTAVTAAFGRGERELGRGENGHGRERERCGAAHGVARGIQVTRGRTGRQVAWQHGRARASGTRPSFWQRRKTAGKEAVVGWAGHLGRQVGCRGKSR